MKTAEEAYEEFCSNGEKFEFTHLPGCSQKFAPYDECRDNCFEKQLWEAAYDAAIVEVQGTLETIKASTECPGCGEWISDDVWKGNDYECPNCGDMIDEEKVA